MTKTMERSKRPQERIIQIMPAQGWWAKYKLEDGYFELARIVCFGLVEWEEAGKLLQDVRPMDADDTGAIELCSGASNFVGLAHEDDSGFESITDRRPRI